MFLITDIETTGLDIKTSQILEVAMLVCDKDLFITDSISLVIHQDDKVLEQMNDWCKKQHAESDLIQEVRESKIDLKQAEERLINFLDYSTKYTKDLPLCGNSVHFDREFLKRDMPKLISKVHYRNIDLSSISEILKVVNPEDYQVLKEYCEQTNIKSHRAVDDCEMSRKLLKYILNKTGNFKFDTPYHEYQHVNQICWGNHD